MLFFNIPSETKKPDEAKKSEEQVSATSHKVDVQTGDQYHAPIVPVKIFHRDQPNEAVITYALLDNQSNACFITDSLAHQFNTKRESVKLNLTTMADKKIVSSEIVHNLMIKGVNEEKEIELPGSYTRDCIPVERDIIPKSETLQQWPHLQEVANKLHPYNDSGEVGLLIGLNCPAALLPHEFMIQGDDDPYAVRTDLGWGISGIVSSSASRSHFAFRTTVREISPTQVQQMFDQDFNETSSQDKPLSIDDRRFLQQMKEAQQRNDGHFILPLPLKKEVKFLNNKQLALDRLQGLKKRLKKSAEYKRDYTLFMQDMIKKGYAERVPENEESDSEGIWYIPHNGVYHPKKPNKIRIVFDCSAKYKGEVLNNNLLQGPNLTNNLAGVLVRFRQESVAVTCDIEGMFHQVVVAPKHRDLLRFLWFENDDVNQSIVEYRMTVHLFGATSSPACASYALRMTADKYEPECGKLAADFICHNFYVDDGLKSVATKDEARALIASSHELCSKGGFNLHKYICTERQVVSSIPGPLQEKNLQPLDLSCDKLPVSRTLGVEWCVENDAFQFRLQMKDKPITRHGIMSTVSSIYDPLGMISPVLLHGRKILQDLCRDGCSWDDEVPEDTELKWQKWCEDLCSLQDLQIQRCYKPKDLGEPQRVELHHFADASLLGYGECSYLRLINENGQIACSLVMAKSRVTPSKQMTVPRLELTAAVLAAKVSVFLENELDYTNIKHYYWTDSKVVLGYINNEERRFHMFVSNRVQQIREMTDRHQWNYIDTKLNPADFTSRGMTADDIKHSSEWWNGPRFLMSSESLPERKAENVLDNADPEVRKPTVHQVSVKASPQFELCERLKYFSDWHRARRAIVLCLKLKQKLRNTDQGCTGDMKLDTEAIESAEKIIIKAVQESAFPEEKELLIKAHKPKEEASNRNLHLKRKSHLYRLDPYIDEDGIMRVGGRIKRVNLPQNLLHPIIMPRSSHITTLVI